MPYIQRENGTVVGIFANAQAGYAEEWREDDDAQVVAFRNPPSSFKDIPRPSFLFMMSKMGITETQVEGLIGQMPEGDARDLALIVFKNQQTFKRDNSLLNTLTAAAGLTSEQVDTAWRAAEQLTW